MKKTLCKITCGPTGKVLGYGEAEYDETCQADADRAHSLAVKKARKEAKAAIMAAFNSAPLFDPTLD